MDVHVPASHMSHTVDVGGLMEFAHTTDVGGDVDTGQHTSVIDFELKTSMVRKNSIPATTPYTNTPISRESIPVTFGPHQIQSITVTFGPHPVQSIPVTFGPHQIQSTRVTCGPHPVQSIPVTFAVSKRGLQCDMMDAARVDRIATLRVLR